MPTVFSHAVAATALITVFPRQWVPRRLLLLGTAFSMAPDMDVVGFRFGVRYEDLLGHRGLSHSIAFAAVLAAFGLLIVASDLRAPARRGLVWLYLFLATASHGLLDAFTDGGLGIALFAPFDSTRYFMPWTPIAVSPIGAGFFSRDGLEVLASEALWICIPAALLAGAALLMRRGLGLARVARESPAD